jgi:DNA-binding response OmpR family regulator
MVVDDDEAFRACIRDASEAEGWEVTEAPGGADALALLGTPPLPDVLVLDLFMPETDGLTVLTELRGPLGVDSVAVVVLSARKGSLTGRISASPGAADCISKPVAPATLVARYAALVPA